MKNSKLMFADSGNNVIRQVDLLTQVVTTVAGLVDQSIDVGPALATTVNLQ